MVTINERNHILAKYLYPGGSARIHTRTIEGKAPIYQLVVGKTLLIVATSNDRLELERYAQQQGWATRSASQGGTKHMNG